MVGLWILVAPGSWDWPHPLKGSGHFQDPAWTHLCPCPMNSIPILVSKTQELIPDPLKTTQ
ncbi:hypothetical protein DSO57_1021437, partial [Entomophthora muscae]